jgi:hypothetical protein
VSDSWRPITLGARLIDVICVLAVTKFAFETQAMLISIPCAYVSCLEIKLAEQEMTNLVRALYQDNQPEIVLFNYIVQALNYAVKATYLDVTTSVPSAACFNRRPAKEQCTKTNG